MRERKTNGKAELNTLNFLRELNQRCEEGKLKAITWLSDKYELSHNTGAACKELNIITFEEGIYKWVPKAEPSRVMALNILDNLLHRSKRKVDPPALPDFAAHLERFTNKLTEVSQSIIAYSKQPSTRMLSRAMQQSPMSGNGLFAEVETKEAKRMDIMKAILTALYTGKSVDDLTDPAIQNIDAAAIRVTNDVINKLYANG
jgi:hypothetical protein